MPINRNPTFLSHMRASVSFIFRFYALRALESAPFVRFGPSSFEATWDARWWAMQGSETRARASNFCEWLLLCRPARSSRRTTRFSRQPTHIWPKIHIWPPKAKIQPNHGLWHLSALAKEWPVWNQWKCKNIKCMTHQASMMWSSTVEVREVVTFVVKWFCQQRKWNETAVALPWIISLNGRWPRFCLPFYSINTCIRYSCKKRMMHLTDKLQCLQLVKWKKLPKKQTC